MKPWLTFPRICRTIAIAIVVLGAWDPVITTSRSARPDVAVVAADPLRDSALVTSISRALGGAFNVIAAPFASASATIIAGEHLPSAVESNGSVAFAVLPDRPGPRVTISAADAPPVVSLNSRVPITVQLVVTGARGRSVDLVLNQAQLAMDRVTVPIAQDRAVITTSLAFVPTLAGMSALDITAGLAGVEPAADRASLAVVVQEHKWPVLFFDARPSWMSTFVRRALEGDNRFLITSRVLTSRNISSDAGAPPGRLDDLAALGVFDAVVIGAPESLTDRDVAGLETYLRRRGGRVILLLDQRAPGPYLHLLGSSAWHGDSSARIVTIAPLDSTQATLRASELAWPAALPEGAVVLGQSAGLPGKDPSLHPIIWQLPVGAGEVTVSGALDAWRFRDSTAFHFAEYWRGVVAGAASSAPAAVQVALAPSVIAPTDSTMITVTLRDAMLAGDDRPVHANVAATLESGGTERQMIRLWPDGARGQFRGVVRRAGVGLHRVVVNAGGQQGDALLLVQSGTLHPASTTESVLGAWVAARGGEMITASQLPGLTAKLRHAISAMAHREPWHPMRSPWWIVPLALLLSGEWWLRRRAGLD